MRSTTTATSEVAKTGGMGKSAAAAVADKGAVELSSKRDPKTDTLVRGLIKTFDLQPGSDIRNLVEPVVSATKVTSADGKIGQVFLLRAEDDKEYILANISDLDELKAYNQSLSAYAFGNEPTELRSAKAKRYIYPVERLMPPEVANVVEGYDLSEDVRMLLKSVVSVEVVKPNEAFALNLSRSGASGLAKKLTEAKVLLLETSNGEKYVLSSLGREDTIEYQSTLAREYKLGEVVGSSTSDAIMLESSDRSKCSIPK